MKQDFTLHKEKFYLKSNDIIHPCNIKLLLNFLNQAGNIEHRHFTRLNKKTQRKIARTIKQSRQLGLLTFGN